MSSISLSLSDVVGITVLSAPTGLGSPNVNTIGLITSEQPVTGAFADGYKLYKSATDVAVDFASNSETLLHATAIFAQNPNIMTTSGYLVIIPLLTGVSETVQEALVRVTPLIFFFGITTTEALSGATLTNLCAYVQSLNKMMVLTSSDVTDLDPSGVFDTIRQAGQTQIRCIYYSVSAAQARVFGSGYLSRGLSTDFAGSLTSSTMHLKTITGYSSDPVVNETILASAQACGAEVYGNIGGIAQVFSSGANGWFDSVYNALWLKITIQITGYNVLRMTNTKIPQTEKGVMSIRSAYAQVCKQAVTCGYVAPGTWDSPDTFGNRDDFMRNITDFGYYIYSEPVSAQLAADRSARKAPLIMIALKEAGAVHSGNIIVSINA